MRAEEFPPEAGLPDWAPESTLLELRMGSFAYGVDTETSDRDLLAVCVPPPLPWSDFLPGFDPPLRPFETFQWHGSPGVDWTVYGIGHYVRLCLENNPNLLESLYAPADCVLRAKPVGRALREARSLFPHRGLIDRYLGAAATNLRSAIGRPDGSVDRRRAYHAVRLVDIAEAFVRTGEVDLRYRADRWRAIRAGEWPREKVQAEAENGIALVRELAPGSPLPVRPRSEPVRNLLLGLTG